jgi:2-methylcitrate dehydratase PrpD
MNSTLDAAVRPETGGTSLTDALVAFTGGLEAVTVPPGVSHAARRHVLDVLGIAAAAGTQEFGRRFAALPLTAPADHVGATAVGLPGGCSPEDAALINGTLAHGLDYDDTYQPGIVHIGAVVVPTALAVGQSVGCDSDEILTAVVIGYEVASRLAESAAGQFHRTGYHATPICGAFAAAAVASRLLHLDARRTRDALGIVGSFAAGIQEFLRDGSDTKRLHPGWAANAGIRAARFADIGFTGPHRVLEGPYGLFATHVGLDHFDPAVVTTGLGSIWNIERVSIKPYPCCHLLHAHIDAARDLRAGGVDQRSITRIRATIHEAGRHLLAEPIAEKRQPSTTYGAQFSLPFAVAAGLLDERIDLRSFAAERLGDPDIRRLAGLTECVVDEDSRYPMHFDGAVEVWLDDGSHHGRRVPVNSGSPERPLDDRELTDKFAGNLDLAGVRASAAAGLARDVLGDGDILVALAGLQRALMDRSS